MLYHMPSAVVQVAGYVLSRVDFAVALFLLLVYVRSWMQKSHVSGCG